MQLFQRVLETRMVPEAPDGTRKTGMQVVARIGDLQVQQNQVGRTRRALLQRADNLFEIHQVGFVEKILPAVVTAETTTRDEQNTRIGEGAPQPVDLQSAQQKEVVERQQEQQARPYEGERHPARRSQIAHRDD